MDDLLDQRRQIVQLAADLTALEQRFPEPLRTSAQVTQAFTQLHLALDQADATALKQGATNQARCAAVLRQIQVLNPALWVSWEQKWPTEVPLSPRVVLYGLQLAWAALPALLPGTRRDNGLDLRQRYDDWMSALETSGVTARVLPESSRRSRGGDA